MEAPQSLGGIKQVFHDPGFAVQGKTRKDQRWISETQEAGIRVLGWSRPAKIKMASAHRIMKKSVPARNPAPAAPMPQAKPILPPITPPPPVHHWWER